MLVCEAYKFAFVHIPRTGGNSVREALARQLHVPLIRESRVQKTQKSITDLFAPNAKSWLAGALQTTPLRYLLTTSDHPSAALMKLTVRGFSSYKTFSFVRNPYSRIVSAYVAGRLIGPPTDESFPKSFEDYLANCKRYVQPQVNFVSFRGKVLVDFIGRFESIQDDFNHVCKWIGLPESELPVLSQSPPGDYREFLTPKTKRWIENTYAEDFAAFNYPVL